LAHAIGYSVAQRGKILAKIINLLIVSFYSGSTFVIILLQH